MAEIKNQQNPPKKNSVDKNGNSRKRFYAKSGNATICIASGLTKNACAILEAHIKGCITNLGGKIECSFRIAQ